jgi:hypothetical protein
MTPGTVMAVTGWSVLWASPDNADTRRLGELQIGTPVLLVADVMYRSSGSTNAVRYFFVVTPAGRPGWIGPDSFAT